MHIESQPCGLEAAHVLKTSDSRASKDHMNIRIVLILYYTIVYSTRPSPTILYYKGPYAMMWSFGPPDSENSSNCKAEKRCWR